MHVDAQLVHLPEPRVLGIEQPVEKVHPGILGAAALLIVDAGDQQLVEALRRPARNLLKLGRDFGDRPGFLGGDLADFGGHCVLSHATIVSRHLGGSGGRAQWARDMSRD